jgi:hypothetical protein
MIEMLKLEKKTGEATSMGENAAYPGDYHYVYSLFI